MFYNYTNEDFTVTWDKFPYTFKSGQSYEGVVISDDRSHSVTLTDSVCEVFAHHLATKVLNDKSLSTNRDDKGNVLANAEKQMQTYNVTSLDALKKRAMTTPDVVVEIPSSVNELSLMAKSIEEVVNEVVAEVPLEVSAEAPKKRGRPRKAEGSPSPEAEFDV